MMWQHVMKIMHRRWRRHVFDDNVSIRGLNWFVACHRCTWELGNTVYHTEHCLNACSCCWGARVYIISYHIILQALNAITNHQRPASKCPGANSQQIDINREKLKFQAYCHLCMCKLLVPMLKQSWATNSLPLVVRSTWNNYNLLFVT